MLKVFLNHASEDRALVLPYFEKLRAIGYEPWIDKKLLPGQDWDEEIQRAFYSSDVVLIFMTPRSVRKRGYVQREIHNALERLKSLLPGDIGVIPLMLEECDVPHQISRVLQYIRLPNEWHKVVESLSLAAKQREIAVNNGLPLGSFLVYPRKEVLEWSGLPGYTLELRFPHFESSTLSNTALELNEYVTAKRFECLLEARRTKLEQDPERFREWFGTDSEAASNSLDYSLEPVLVGESILSMILYEFGFFAGAAHGFHGATTHNFVVKDDGLVKLRLEDFFSDPYLACPRFTELCIQKIAKEWEERFETPPSADDREEMARSFPPEWSTYLHFSLSATGISVYFPPYTLGGYAAGSWVAEFSFEELGPLLKCDGPHFLAKKAHAVSFVHPDIDRPGGDD
ncbi:MAG: TIR domain-containing protein [Thiobacillus sp.]|nr:TIR domain-containing protein [Thiobacillus sp.]